MLVDLVERDGAIQEYNDYLDRRIATEKTDADNLESLKLKSLTDRFYPYAWMQIDLEYEMEYKIIQDLYCNDFTGIYLCELNSHYGINIFTTNQLDDSFCLRSYTYGVCDNATQVIEHYKETIKLGKIDDSKKHVILMTPIFRQYENEFGWRWKKWGRYIGIQERKHEYLYDEEDIDLVYFFEIIQLV